MAVSSQLAAVVASQTGKIQGELEARIISQVFDITSKFKNQCPDIATLEAIVDNKNNLLKVVNSFTKVTNKYGALANKLNPAIRAARILIALLKRDPTPIASGTPPLKDWGGLISSKTSGMQNSSADRLRKVSLLLEALEDDVIAIKSLVGGVNPSLNQVRNSLGAIDTSLFGCINNIINSTPENNLNTLQNIGNNIEEDSLTQQDRAKELIKKIQPFQSANTQAIEAQDFSYRNSQGIDYTLEIITVTEIDRVIPGQEDTFTIETEKVPVNFIAPKRYAQAKNKVGRVILRGNASFSADTQILLDELKFRLDNQLE
tara:strand:- start:44 stop:994 length:951 start_codon:yes stop_codon:yes gene_type:complete